VLEELIEAEADPRHLTVVSSDHRIQRAARRRKAIFVDSDAWLGELRRRIKATDDAHRNTATAAAPGVFENPFPPGYGEDLLESGQNDLYFVAYRAAESKRNARPGHSTRHKP